VKLNQALSYVVARPEFENQPRCGILDTLQNTEGGLWRASKQRVAIVESGCDKCKYEPDSDLCANAATDLAQMTQMKERRGSNLRDVWIHCQFSINACTEITNDGCRLD